ncbi:MAG TPA: DEAD/DEAH box helicase, partial [Polyangiales bacterium]|nr:DEAD/DEAH box helicase [Polyangiales bacterium]
MNIALTSPEAPAESSGFASLNLSEEVRRALDEIGYTQPTPVQEATYPLAVDGKDIIVQARTGTGKTAAFGIPLVDKIVTTDPVVQALVLAPTRELALQSQREIARLGQHRRLQTVAVYGGAPMGKQIDDLRAGAQIVSGTPGRVLDHLKRGTLDASRMRVLILDEMDEMLSMGFAKELNAILELIPSREKRQTMCFSATVDGEVRRHAERHMNNPEVVSLSSDGAAASTISHSTYMVTGANRTGDLVRILEVEDPESAIIFCNMRSETERVAGALKQAGFNADWLNGDLPQKDRERIMQATRDGKLRYLVATDVAARGIDISHLTHVINYSFPESAAVYVHRTGRTGRAGRTGSAISLVSPDELGRLYYLRLEYKISPVERSLPTHGELKTQQEIDRITLLETAFVEPPAANDLAVARRLLTHPRI